MMVTVMEVVVFVTVEKMVVKNESSKSCKLVDVFSRWLGSSPSLSDGLDLKA
jgi:hypothetical protein